MNISITLGRWLNDDGTITKVLENRLLMTKELYDSKRVDKMILSGGVANQKAGISEARAMYNYLLKLNVKEEDLILEEESHTTSQNFEFSLPKALAFDPKEIYVVSSNEHFTYYDYNPIKMCTKWLNTYKKDNNIRLIIYTDTKSFD